MNPTTLGIIRHVLTFGGGLIVAKGWADNGTVETIVGAVVTLVGAVWSIIQKRSV
jgi:hypothetical protein